MKELIEFFWEHWYIYSILYSLVLWLVTTLVFNWPLEEMLRKYNASADIRDPMTIHGVLIIRFVILMIPFINMIAYTIDATEGLFSGGDGNRAKRLSNLFSKAATGDILSVLKNIRVFR